MVCIKKQPYIYYVRLTFKNRHFFRYLTCLLDRGHIKNGDLVFITNKNAAIYFGEVFLCFYASELDFIWSGRRGWPYKVLLKDVFQVFFPDPKNSAGKDFEKLLELNSFSPSVSSIPNIERQYNQGVGFRNIIGNNNTANFQGSSPINISKNQLLKNLEMYMIKIHFEGIRKIG